MDQQSSMGRIGRETRRWLWVGAGILALFAGAIGAVLPVMPTTVFMILAAACFARSSPRLEAWIIDHPRFGPAVQNWRSSQVVPRYAKLAAVLGISLGFSTTLVSGLIGPFALALLGVGLLLIAIWIVTRPETVPERATRP